VARRRGGTAADNKACTQAPRMNPPSHTTAQAETAQERFFGLLDSSLAQASFVKLVLAKPHAAETDLQRVVVRRIRVRDEDCLSFVFSHTTRDITKNLPLAAGVARVRELLGPAFRNAHLHTRSEEAQLSLSKKGKAFLSITAVAVARAADLPAATHDREKQRALDLNRPFLVELGVTTAQHQLVPAMARKWKQINRFVEIFAGALAASPLADAEQVRVVDFGSGKGYLTFAVHEWLQHVKGVGAQVTGVELRPDMVQLGNDAIARLGLQGLRMELGDVRSWQPAALDVMIALHACDVATDYAIHLGLRAGAQIIMCSPCCHKQIRPQLLSPHPMRPLLQHGVHVDQQAEMLTDSLRALLLEAQGYDTRVFEFITLEHTRKNKMILAVKRRVALPAEPALAQIRELKAFFGIREQCLETLLAAG
jgi:SAM-dependent methyltransferase